MTPTFSIIIPVFNVAPYLRECLDSVLAQTYTDWEAICVDDGSTDGSSAILDEYAAKDDRFKVIHQRNSGVSAARNAGLDSADGTWICFVDSDDIVSEKWVSTLHHLATDHPNISAIRGEYVIFGGNARPAFAVEKFNLELITNPLGHENIGRLLHYKFLYMGMYAFRRDAIKEVRFQRFICGEDRLYTFSCLQRVSNLLLTTFVFYGYRSRLSSYSHSGIRTFKGWSDELRYRLCFLENLNTLGFSPDLSQADWLLPFIRREYVHGSRLYRGNERKILISQYLESLPKLLSYPFVPLKDKRYYGFVMNNSWRLFVDMLPRTFRELFPCSLRRIYRRLCHHGEFEKAKTYAVGASGSVKAS